jgi:hypothetical protein
MAFFMRGRATAATYTFQSAAHWLFRFDWVKSRDAT